jgi:hypothetical protein
MALQDFFVAVRDDEFGKLRCEKPLQPSDPAQFVNLLGNALFKATVQFRNLFSALAQFTQEPRVLNRDDRLVGEGAHQLDLPLGKGFDPLSAKGNYADWLTLPQ